MTNLKRKAWKWGLYAETICSFILRLKGYKIIAKRYKTKVGEIDLIASRARTLVFIEVKARPSLEAGLLSISDRQRLRIQNAAEIFLSRWRKKQFKAMRFDVMVVVPWRLPHHLVNAWQID